MSTMLSVGGDVYSRTDAPADELFFGSVDGLFVLRRDGERWSVEHSALPGLHVSSIAEHAPSGMMFAGTHNGGLYASADHGRTWERREQGLPEKEVYSLAVVESNGQVRLYAGTEPAHLYVSTDLGKSWTDLPAIHEVPGTETWTFPAPPHHAHVKHIRPDPSDAQALYVSVEQGGLFKSEDGGQTFHTIFEIAGADAHRVSIPPTRPDRLYLTRGDWSSGWEGVYLSTNGGADWKRLNDRSLGIGYPDATLIHPDRPDLMFIAGGVVSPPNWGKLAPTAGTKVARSTDAGETWHILPGIPPSDDAPGNVEAMAIDVWPGGFGIFAGTTDGNIFYTQDEGESWSELVRGLPAISKAGHWRWRQRLAAA